MSTHDAPGAPLHIAGTGTALPGDPVDNARLGKAFGIDEEWIDLFVGTRTRHFGWDLATGEIRHSLADLCAEAAARAADAAGTHLGDLDFLVLATTTPDRLLPTTANEVADRLGLDHLPTYQIQAGCSGAVQALDLARALTSRRTADQLRSWTRRGDVAPYLDAFARLGPLPTAPLPE